MPVAKYPYEEFVQERVVAWLIEKKWRIIKEATRLSDKGADIIAGKYGKNNDARLWTIEVKGGSRHKADYKKAETISIFHSGLAQIITRMGRNTQPANKGGDKYSLAFPDYFKKHIIKQCQTRPKLPWNVCQQLNLSIFLVDENGEVEFLDWKAIRENNRHC